MRVSGGISTNVVPFTSAQHRAELPRPADYALRMRKGIEVPLLVCCAVVGIVCSTRAPSFSSRGGALSNLCAPARQDAWFADPALCLVEYASGVPGARGMAFAPNGDLFVVSYGQVIVLYDADGNGLSDPSERATFGSIEGLNHGIAFSPDRRFLYVSNETTVYRWPYSLGQRSTTDAPQVVVSGISSGGHGTRTLLFDSAGRLYVAIGSEGNLDTDAQLRASRSQIRRFAVSSPLPPNGIDFLSGELVASGMRNEVGIAFDSQGRFWGVENGRDQLLDDRYGGDIHYDNPAEELNRIDGPGPTYFGYPQCWSEGTLTGGNGPGTQHADQQMPPELLQTDAWCQDTANVRPPAAVVPAHWAPLGITEYTGSLLPSSYRGDLFIASHGSWNREIGQVGRLVARAHVRSDGSVASIDPIVGERGGNGNLREGYWGVRPVDIQQGPDGALYFSDDLGGRVFRIGAQGSGVDGSDAGPDGGPSPTDGGSPPSDGSSPGPTSSSKSGCSSVGPGGSIAAVVPMLVALALAFRRRRGPSDSDR